MGANKLKKFWLFNYLLVALVSASPALAGFIGHCGGTGGDRTRTLQCGPGEHVVGVSVREGLFTNLVGIACAKVPNRARPAVLSNHSGFKSAGTGDGERNFSSVCRSGSAVTGLDFKSGFYVDRIIRGSCERKGLSGFVADAQNLKLGSSIRSNCDLTCPPGEAIYKLDVRYGLWIDRIRVHCRK